MDKDKKKKDKLIKQILLILATLFLLLTLKTTEYIEVGRKSFAAVIILLLGTGTGTFIFGRIKKAERIADISALVFSAVAVYYAIALISIDKFCFYPSKPEFNPFMHVYGFLTVFMIYLAVFAIVGNAKHAVFFSNLLFTVFAMGNNLCYRFRERPLAFSDFSAWKETVNIAGEGYGPSFDAKVYSGIAFVVVSTILIIAVLLLTESLREENIKKGKRVFSSSLMISRILCLIAAVFLYFLMYSGDFLKEQNINRVFWDDSSLRESPFLDFCCSIKNSQLEKPEKYAPESIFLNQKSSFETVKPCVGMKPNIIVVMSEGYSDMRDMLPIETNTNPYSFFDEFKERARWGKLYVSTFGGGTANTEFEFLTGCDTAFFPTGNIPYNWYIQREFPSLFSTLKSHGYSTMTLHPYLSNFWNRVRVYEYFGADESYWEEDYDNSESFGCYVSDKENYKFLIERFEEKEPGKPIFIFNITMQNHGPYTLNLPSNVRIKSEIAYPELEAFLNLVKITGEETEKLIGYFQKVEEPTVIVFFGDHLPAIDKDFFEEYEILCEREPDISRRVEMSVRKYMTEYYIWANFDFEPGRADDFSINYLQGELMDFVGLEAPPFINYQHETLRQKWPVIVKSGCKRADGEWVEFGNPEFLEDEDTQIYYALQYNLIRDITNRRNDIFYLN